MHKRTKATVLIVTLIYTALNFLYNHNKVSAKEGSLNTLTRIWGKDRYETAVEMSKHGWSNGSESAFIVNGEDFADALAVAPLAKIKDSPILLTKRNALEQTTMQELKRLNMKKVYIIGGEGAVSKEVEDSIRNDLGVNSERIYGKDRYETSVRIAERLGKMEQVFIVSGENYADALSIAEIAAMKKAPIILTEKDGFPNLVKDYINKNNNNINKAYIVGGLASINKNLEGEFKNFERLAGLDRYETNKKILKRFQDELNFKKIYMVKGDGFADALSVSTLAARHMSPVFLVADNMSDTADVFRKSMIFPTSNITVLGDKSNISDSMVDNMRIVTEILDSSGLYNNKDINNNVEIVGTNIILKNSRIRGNLYIDSQNIFLSNVIVDGIIYVNSGEGNSIKFNKVSCYDTIMLSGEVQDIKPKGEYVEDTSNKNDNGRRNENNYRSDSSIDGNGKNNYSDSGSNNYENSNGNNNNPEAQEDNSNGDSKSPDENGDNINTTTSAAVAVTGIKLEKEALDIYVEDSLKLNYEIYPENASNKNVIWYCDNNDVLEINTDGIINAKAPGEAKIQLVAEDGGFKAECIVRAKKKLEIQELIDCKDITEVKNLVDTNILNINIQGYDNLSYTAKYIIATSVYENKDTFENKDVVQKHINKLISDGYKLDDSTATLIEGVESNLNNAVKNLQVSNIYIPSGTYVLRNTLNINRYIHIEGGGRNNTKIQLDLPADPLTIKRGINVEAGGKLDLSNLSIDGLYNDGKDVNYAVQSYGNLILENINVQNIGDHKQRSGYGIVIDGGICSIDNSAFNTIKESAIVSNFSAVLHIGENGGNIFEGTYSDNQAAAIYTRSTGGTSIMNNTIAGYNGSGASGLKLAIGGRYTVKNNIIKDNNIGIKAASKIVVNLGMKGNTAEILLQGNPECIGNKSTNVQIITQDL